MLNPKLIKVDVSDQLKLSGLPAGLGAVSGSKTFKDGAGMTWAEAMIHIRLKLLTKTVAGVVNANANYTHLIGGQGGNMYLEFLNSVSGGGDTPTPFDMYDRGKVRRGVEQANPYLRSVIGATEDVWEVQIPFDFYNENKQANPLGSQGMKYGGRPGETIVCKVSLVNLVLNTLTGLYTTLPTYGGWELSIDVIPYVIANPYSIDDPAAPFREGFEELVTDSDAKSGKVEIDVSRKLCKELDAAMEYIAIKSANLSTIDVDQKIEIRGYVAGEQNPEILSKVDYKILLSEILNRPAGVVDDTLFIDLREDGLHGLSIVPSKGGVFSRVTVAFTNSASSVYEAYSKVNYQSRTA